MQAYKPRPLLAVYKYQKHGPKVLDATHEDIWGNRGVSSIEGRMNRYEVH